jgi:hypothetical protein
MVSIFVNKALHGRVTETLGMSGIIYGMYTFIALEAPDTRFTLINGYTFTPWELLLLHFVLDFALNRGVDHACHAGGACWGYFFSRICTRGGLGHRSIVCTEGAMGFFFGHENVLHILSLDKRIAFVVQIFAILALAFFFWAFWMESRLPKLPPKPKNRAT